MSTPSPEAIALRAARIEDEPIIRRLVRSSDLNPLGIDWRRFTVATLGEAGPIVGMGQIKPHGDGSRELASIAVVEAQRGKGIARMLIEHLLATEVGAIYLTCRPQLRGFYVPFGFVEVHDASAMPLYFRRIARVTGWIRRFRSEWGPAIMRRNPV